MDIKTSPQRQTFGEGQRKTGRQTGGGRQRARQMDRDTSGEREGVTNRWRERDRERKDSGSNREREM